MNRKEEQLYTLGVVRTGTTSKHVLFFTPYNSFISVSMHSVISLVWCQEVNPTSKITTLEYSKELQLFLAFWESIKPEQALEVKRFSQFSTEFK